ncbi:hypothetical protein GCM10010359_44220 [Streptomyces morookaense]|nr:hypothetical protein GCM10010359_44220 [Streptomyces morookaense]
MFGGGDQGRPRQGLARRCKLKARDQTLRRLLPTISMSAPPWGTVPSARQVIDCTAWIWSEAIRPHSTPN